MHTSLALVLVLGAVASACRPTSSAADARPITNVVDATPPPPHADPTPAAVAYFADIGPGLEGLGLVTALHAKLSGDHVSISFDGLWAAYDILDAGRGSCTGISDFYSSKCWDASEACGNFAQEGDCFNREHSWPKSWWGGGTGPAQHEDLVAVIPADGYVNGLRDDDPLGNVISANYSSSNGSKRGLCNVAGTAPGSKCFEPADQLKGDFARIYFYMAVRYDGDFPCCDEIAVKGSDILPWQETMLRAWHAADPVDIEERDRNERLFAIQKNRNPFVDFPEFVERITDF